MKTQPAERKRKILRKVFAALSLSSAIFVFQACYGTPEDFGADVCIQGFVFSKATNLPIPGIKVSIENQYNHMYTNTHGFFEIYSSQDSIQRIRFEDVDSTENGTYLLKDTIVKKINYSTTLIVHLDVK